MLEQFNARLVGFSDTNQMIAQMIDSESAQVGTMAKVIEGNGLDGALRTIDWKRFAHAYNGADYQINDYDTRLGLAHGGMPARVI